MITIIFKFARLSLNSEVSVGQLVVFTFIMKVCNGVNPRNVPKL